jgi:hypothetical protein
MNESKQILDICMKKAIELLNTRDNLNQSTPNTNFKNYEMNEQICNIEKEVEGIRKIMEVTQNYITIIS